MRLKAIAFDWGHTVIDENADSHVPLDLRPIHTMLGVSDVLPQLTLPLALWANTRVAKEPDVRAWLERAGLGPVFRWVTTSADVGARKPDPRFFAAALSQSGLTREDVLFVGNQRNTDVLGAEAFGIATVWLSAPEYRSADDTPCEASPSYTISTLYDLPSLIYRLQERTANVGMRS